MSGQIPFPLHVPSPNLMLMIDFAEQRCSKRVEVEFRFGHIWGNSPSSQNEECWMVAAGVGCRGSDNRHAGSIDLYFWGSSKSGSIYSGGRSKLERGVLVTSKVERESKASEGNGLAVGPGGGGV